MSVRERLRRVRVRQREYIRERGVPEPTDDNPERPPALKTAAAVLVAAIGAVPVAAVALPVAVYAYSLLGNFWLTFVAVGVPAYFAAGGVALYVGGPIVDELVGVRREAVA